MQAIVAQAAWPFCHAWGGGWGGWMGWSVHLVGWALVIGLIVWAVVYASRSGSVRSGTAADVLAERYARGELTTDEYRERRDALR